MPRMLFTWANTTFNVFPIGTNLTNTGKHEQIQFFVLCKYQVSAI